MCPLQLGCFKYLEAHFHTYRANTMTYKGLRYWENIQGDD